MKKSLILFLLIFLIPFFLINSCRKDKAITDFPAQEIDDVLSEEALKIIDTIQSSTVPISTIVLSNGETVESFVKKYDSAWHSHFRSADPFEGIPLDEVKNRLCARFLTAAAYLTNRNNFKKPNQGSSKPAQNGLAYVRGSRDTIERQYNSEGLCKQYMLYGLDCSGFFYNLFKYSGLAYNNLSGNAYQQHLVTNLQKTLFQFPSTSDLKYENLPNLNPKDFESGDVVYWSRLNGNPESHIGMIIKDKYGNLFVYQSNGSKDSDCEKNFSDSRGPRILRLDNSYWFGPKSSWEIVRLNSDPLNGIYVCQDAYYTKGVLAGMSYLHNTHAWMERECNGNAIKEKYKIDIEFEKIEFYGSDSFRVLQKGIGLLDSVARYNNCQIVTYQWWQTDGIKPLDMDRICIGQDGHRYIYYRYKRLKIIDKNEIELIWRDSTMIYTIANPGGIKIDNGEMKVKYIKQ
jgi:hypothetical protein